MRAKATHIGSCQKCGHVQKLPGGKLAKHGYSVRWHFFEGVCSAANELPYEQSCELIKGYIKLAEGFRERIKEHIKEELKPATEPKGWYHEYVTGKGRFIDGYHWRKVDLTIMETAIGYPMLAYVNYEEKKKRLDLYDYTIGTDFLKAATKMNQNYVEQELKSNLRNIEQYIRWQQERVDRWKLTDLKPVPPPVIPDPNKPKRMRRRWH